MERALSHLRRQIVADPSIQRKWLAAFKEGETACEKLGESICYLTAYGRLRHTASMLEPISVLGTPLGEQEVEEARRADAPLVLTEWKIARGESNVDRKWDEARSQIHEYKQGILGGFELRRVHYALVVCEQDHHRAAERLPSGAEVRYMSIPVIPSNPSIHAKTASRVRKGRQKKMKGGRRAQAKGSRRRR